jgi:hypothetical protein
MVGETQLGNGPGRDTMSKRLNILAILLAVTGAILVAAVTNHATANGRGDGPIVYVTGQGLFYDSIVLTDLPQQGPFQLLETMTGPSPDGLQTQFGPGDTGYVGGRWWVDANGNGEMDEGDAFFMCPLLPAAAETGLRSRGHFPGAVREAGYASVTIANRSTTT